MPVVQSRNSKFRNMTLQSLPEKPTGDALKALGAANDNVVVVDAEVSNSTYADKFAHSFLERFFENVHCRAMHGRRGNRFGQSQ